MELVTYDDHMILEERWEETQCLQTWVDGSYQSFVTQWVM